jgi:tetratricopeptide (TPR) repeat protein
MASQTAAPTLPGYAEELNRAELDIAKLETSRADLSQRVRLAYRLFHRASLTGGPADFDAAEAAVAEALREFGPKEDLCLLKANLDFRFHRLAEVRRDLEMPTMLATRMEGRAMKADLDFQEGRYEAARLEFQRLIEENRTWDNVARLAHWHGKLGDIEEADRLYEEAEDDLTAKQMRSYAWLELQRGVLALTHGRFSDAARHYSRADASYPGHWQTDEHFAELRAAEGNFLEAEELFLRVIARSPRPETQQALGELYTISGRAEEARIWLYRSLAKYLESIDGGGVHYFHHLADFYIDARPEAEEAVRWARKDLEMRSNFSTQAAMANALYLDDQIDEAVKYIRLALQSGVRDAHIYASAAKICEACGEFDESKEYAEAALRINPRHDCFHMHH